MIWGVAIVIQLLFFLSCAETGGKNYHFVHETADIGESDHYYVQTFSKMFMVYVFPIAVSLVCSVHFDFTIPTS